MNNVPYYDKNDIRITKGIFELPDGKQYSIKHIDSVDIKKEYPSRIAPSVCIGFGFISDEQITQEYEDK